MGIFFAVPPVAAVAQDSAGLKQELDTIYERLLGEPGNVALNRRLVEVAIALKDYDAAIGAVERLIFYQPNNAALQIEVARLYLKIESRAAARGYLTDALALPGLSAADRQAAEVLIAQIDDETKASPWAGIVQVGGRWQSNANVGPSELNTEDQFPPELPVEDWNVFGLGTILYSSPVTKNLYLEGSLSAYYADQLKVDRLDLGFAEFSAGPRIVSDDGRLSLKPYAITQGILLGADPYQFAYGGGGLVRLGIADGWWVEPQFEYRDRRYYNSDDYIAATDQTGEIFTYAVNGSGDLGENFGLRGRVALNQNRADQKYASYDQYYANLSLPISFDIFSWENWSLTPFGTVFWADYKGIAPAEKYVGFDTIRHDFQWSVGASLEMPITGHVSISGQVQYTSNESNLNRFTYDNIQALFGPMARF
jgi:hypothetical protein